MQKLVKVITRKGVLRVDTGLQINGPDVGIGPGGLDSEVTRNPLTNEVYIPGSSVKGKMRAELEHVKGKFGEKGKPCGCGRKDCIVCTMFGAHMNTSSQAGIPRLKVYDLTPTDEYKTKRLTEVKTATSINRETGTALNGPLRPVERVCAGSEFNYEMVLQIFEGDDENKLKETLDACMKLVEVTGLGSGTSRGNGKVTFISKEDTEIVFN